MATAVAAVAKSGKVESGSVVVTKEKSQNDYLDNLNKKTTLIVAPGELK